MRLFGGKIEKPVIIFKKQTKTFLGKEVSLIVAIEIRFGSHYISMQRILRCKDALRATMNCHAFKVLNIKGFDDVLVTISNDLAWDKRRHLLTLLRPWMTILRLADSYEAHMDKQKYYVMKAREMIVRSTVISDDTIFPPVTNDELEEDTDDDSDDDDVDDAEDDDDALPLPYASDEHTYVEDDDDLNITEEDVVPGTQMGPNLAPSGHLKVKILGIIDRYIGLLYNDYVRTAYHQSVVPHIYAHSKVRIQFFSTLHQGSAI